MEIIFEFTGNLNPGETFVVDAETMEVSIDSNEVYGSFSGDFPRLEVGSSNIVYTDSETDRDLELIISKEDRHV